MDSKITTNTVMMPRELTAENGAKELVSGEFFETIEVDCYFCNSGTVTRSCGGEHDCDKCGATGFYQKKVTVSWTTIKEIYAMAVDKLGH